LKKTILLLLLVILSASATAYNFGTFTYKDTRQATTRNISFQLGLMNPGNSSLAVKLSSDGLENGEVVFPRNGFILEPTEITKNPRGSGWFSIAPGRYSKVRKVSFWVLMDRKVDENFSVQVRAEKSGSDASGIRPKAVQIRDYRYTINYAEEEAVKVDRGYQRYEEGDESPEIIRKSGGDSNVSGENNSDRKEVIILNASETSKTEEDTSSKREGVSGLTLLLSVGAVVSLIYLWTVI
jgi:hypothetical protein